MNLTEMADDESITLSHLISVRPDGLSFDHCWRTSANTPELVQQFDRLYGSSLAGTATPVERLIDDATGKTKDDCQAFLRFVWNFIYLRTPTAMTTNN